MPLRATTSITRGATQRELSGRVRDQIRDRIRDRLREEIGSRVGDATDRELLALAAERIRDLKPGKIRSRIEDLSASLAERELSGLVRDRVRDRLREEIGGRVDDATDRELLALAAERIRDLKPGKIRSRIEDLRASLADRSFPDQIEIPGFSSVTDVGLGSILERLTDIFYLRGSVEYNRIGFQTDLSYVGLGGQTATSVTRERPFFPDLPQPGRTLKTQVAVTQGIYDFALRYRFGERERAISTPGAVTVIPYAGVRVVDLGLETNNTFKGSLLQTSREFSFGEPIAQPLVGLQGQVFMTSRLRLFARGDLGGFGTNGEVDMSGNAQVGVGYAIGNSTQLDLSWRYLYLARDNGKTPNAAYTIDQNGIEVGVKFFF
jgi:hypothetical protein